MEADSIFKSTLDHLPDGVLLVGADRRILYINPAFAKMWRIPAHLLDLSDRRSIFEHVATATVDPNAFVAEVQRLYGSNESSEDEIETRYGQILSRRSVPFLEGEGTCRIWIFTDVTQARYAEIDTLTGLPNRRAYARRYPLIASANDGLVSGVAIMDLDNFKAYNDLYGHAAGDEVLVCIGRLLAARLGPEDSAFRIGGEEFFIACRGRTDDGVLGFFEGIRQSIFAESISHAGNPPSNVVTGSFGLACFRDPQEPKGLFDAVDRALYFSKASGRNRITLAGAGADRIADTAQRARA
jgi:diguanylate cyclase (GGDEF)-like protein